MSVSRERRVVFRQRGLVEVEEFELGAPTEGEMLIRTRSTLISPGTETAFLMALANTSGEFPQYPGYSNAGLVERVGNAVKEIHDGDRVVSHRPHASRVLAREEETLRIPDAVSYDEASFFALGSVALQGVRKGKVELGDSVLVVGQGLVGNLALQLAKLSGGTPVIGADLCDYRLGISLKVGADYAINLSRDNLDERVGAITEGRGASVVIEATGSPSAIPTALTLASRYGRVILLGSPRGDSTVDFYTYVHRKGLQIVGAHNSTRPRYESTHGAWTIRDDAKLVLRLIEEGLLNVRALITSKMSYQEATEAYRRLRESKDETIGVIIDWE